VFGERPARPDVYQVVRFKTEADQEEHKVPTGPPSSYNPPYTRTFGSPRRVGPLGQRRAKQSPQTGRTVSAPCAYNPSLSRVPPRPIVHRRPGHGRAWPKLPTHTRWQTLPRPRSAGVPCLPERPRNHILGCTRRRFVRWEPYSISPRNSPLCQPCLRHLQRY
jgi:hypothetical protein